MAGVDSGTMAGGGRYLDLESKLLEEIDIGF